MHLGSSFFLSSFLRFLDCLVLALLLRFLLLLLSFSASLSDEVSEELEALEEESEASESEQTFFFFSRALKRYVKFRVHAVENIFWLQH